MTILSKNQLKTQEASFTIEIVKGNDEKELLNNCILKIEKQHGKVKFIDKKRNL